MKNEVLFVFFAFLFLFESSFLTKNVTNLKISVAFEWDSSVFKGTNLIDKIEIVKLLFL